MKLDMVRLPLRGLPSAGTRVEATDGDGPPVTDDAASAASKSEVVLLHPEDATALLTDDDGRRFERPVQAIVTGPPRERRDTEEAGDRGQDYRFCPRKRGRNEKRQAPTDEESPNGPPTR